MNYYEHDLAQSNFKKLKADVKQMQCNTCKTKMQYYMYGRTQIFCPLCTTKLLQPKGQLYRAINATLTGVKPLKQKPKSVLDEQQLIPPTV